jgi:hypothetical protein
MIYDESNGGYPTTPPPVQCLIGRYRDQNTRRTELDTINRPKAGIQYSTVYRRWCRWPSCAYYMYNYLSSKVHFLVSKQTVYGIV